MPLPPPLPLAYLSFPVEQGRGRRYPEPSHPYRSDFERDRDRILHSHAFRRLEGKTQVFALGLNAGFAEALSLVHDIGHPPFAHAGEGELNRLMREHGDRFDHNIHALRIVEWFEHRYARFPGLNLTFEVREGIVKHSRDFGPGEIPELDEFLPGLRPPLEAQLIDLCDEVAYNTADLDDAYGAGLLPVEALREDVPLFGAIADAISHRFPGASPDIQMYECLRVLIDSLASALLEGTVNAVREAGVRTVDDVRRHESRLARFTEEGAVAGAQVKAFLRKHVYRAEAVVAERKASMERMSWLFQYFITQPESLPAAYEAEAAGGRPRHRVVCDYIAGMTDRYFNQIYTQICGLLGDNH
jgi:dGTPase